MAAKEMGIASVPTVKLSHPTEAERRAYVLADNKLAPNPQRRAVFASEPGIASEVSLTSCLKFRILSSALKGKNSITSKRRTTNATDMLKRQPSPPRS